MSAAKARKLRFPRAVGISPPVRQLGLKENQLGASERRVRGQSLEYVFPSGVQEPVQQEVMPRRQRAGPLPGGWLPDTAAPSRLCRGILGGLAQRVEVAVGKEDPGI